MNPTHICIKTGDTFAAGCNPLIKKGDPCTLKVSFPDDKVVGRVAGIFYEDLTIVYSMELFLPLPPPKIEYRIVHSEIEIKEEEVCTN